MDRFHLFQKDQKYCRELRVIEAGMEEKYSMELPKVNVLLQLIGKRSVFPPTYFRSSCLSTILELLEALIAPLGFLPGPKGSKFEPLNKQRPKLLSRLILFNGHLDGMINE